MSKRRSITEICQDGDIEALKLVVIHQLQGDFFHLSHFLGVHSFRFSNDIATACITKDRDCLLNPEFIINNANTPQKLTMVVCHEVYHKVLKHIEIPSNYVEDIAMDAVINAMLCQVFHGGRYWAFFKDYYSPDIFPNFILRPHSKMSTMSFMDKRYYRVLYYKKDVNHIDEVHHDPNVTTKRNWGLTYEDVVDWLSRISEDQLDEALKKLDELDESSGVPLPGGSILIGDHKAGKITRTEEDDIDELSDIIKEAGEKVRTKFAGSGETLFDEMLDLLEAKKNSKLAEAFDKALTQSVTSKVTSTIRSAFPDLPERSVVPLGIGRKEVVMLAAGFLPVFWKTVVPDINSGAVHVYIDVSGSMGEWVKWCYELCLSLADWLHEPVHLFSNKVVDISIQQLRRGKVSTTYGTDFDCICEHMVANDVKKTVIITDGYASMSAENQNILKQQDRHLFTAFIPNRWGRKVGTDNAHGILKEISYKYWELTEEDKIV